jgi:hypothetical protein
MRWLLLSLVLGCSTTDVDEPPEAPSGFTPDAASDGARLWIDVAGDGKTREISLWAAELGSVLGIASHLVLDPTFVAIDGATHEAMALGDAVTLFEEVAPGDFTLGLARRGVDAGEAPLDDVTRLATVSVTLLAAGERRFAPSRVMVRRADGAYVPTASLGGTLRVAAGDLP